MLKIITVAAVAALTATTVQAASVTVVLNGKTSEQVSAEIARAAHIVCTLDAPQTSLRLDSVRACEKEVTAQAMAEVEVKMARLAERTQLAKR